MRWLKNRSTENAEELKIRLNEDIKLSQFTVRHFSKSTETWKRLLCHVNLAIFLQGQRALEQLVSVVCLQTFLVLSVATSGLGMALKKLPSWGQHVLDSEDPQDWAEKIKEVREKGARNPASEAKQLRTKDPNIARVVFTSRSVRVILERKFDNLNNA